jgi:hypothetical protein
MKKHQLFILGLGLLLAASCRKTDIQKNEAAPIPATENNLSSSVVNSQWISVGNWTSVKNDSSVTYTSTIKDSNINLSVLTGGMVMAFTKNGSSVTPLPFSDTKAVYWYYQVSNGSISFSADVHGKLSSVNPIESQYFIFSKNDLEALAAKGYGKAELMQLSYENLKTVLAN